MTLRRRGYLSEIGDIPPERKYSHRGFIVDWRYPIGGVQAGQLIRDGKAKLLKGSANRVLLKVKGGKEYKVKAALAKGMLPRFWLTPEELDTWK